jgi:hypothetical protein
MTARNRVAYERGQAIRTAVREILLEHAREHPLGRPLTGKDVKQRLSSAGYRLALSTTLWHMDRVRLEAELGWDCSNSSNADIPS